jgi:peptidoglycan/xylan/chitin deacetylase (PgdA/CDA1 family)
MNSQIVLMYHALWSDAAEYQRIAPEDRPYAVNAEAFEEQVACMAEHAHGNNIHITFDDGHKSACEIALPVLQKYGFTAAVFITTAWLGNREGYCGDDELAQLKRAGWSIGAHGDTHRFLTTLNDDELEQELTQSLSLLKQYLGDQPSMSYPGGRFGQREIDAAREHGFVSLYGSRPAHWNPDRDDVVPRHAVRGNTTMKSFKTILSANSTVRLGQLASYYSKTVVRKVLGDDFYHSLYRYLRS